MRRLEETGNARHMPGRIGKPLPVQRAVSVASIPWPQPGWIMRLRICFHFHYYCIIIFDALGTATLFKRTVMRMSMIGGFYGCTAENV